jgi:hypothetical protein
MVLDVNVICSVGSHGVAGKLDRFLVVFIDGCGTSLLLVDIMYELHKAHNALPNAAEFRILCFYGGKIRYLMFLGSPNDYPAIGHNNHFS